MIAPSEGAPGPMAVGTRGQSEHQHLNSAITATDPQTAERAQVEHLRGTLAQRGIDLLANGDDRYTARRGKLTQDLTGIDAVERLARLLGASV